MIPITSESCHIQYILTCSIPNLKSKAPVKFSNWYIISTVAWYRYATPFRWSIHDLVRFYDKISLDTGMDPWACACESENNSIKIYDVSNMSIHDGVGNLPCLPPVCKTSNGSWCMGIKGEMSGTVCVTFTWYMYIYELFIAFVCFVVCSLL